MLRDKLLRAARLAQRAGEARSASAAAALGPDPYKSRAAIPGVTHVVAVASGKGGVGKSTTAVNIAVAAAAAGWRVGVLDADVYGPSVPLLLGLPHIPPLLDEKNLMEPPSAHGVVAMSMGLLLKPGQAAAWRGPMVMGALEKLVRGTAWPRLDLLVVDMPPGTGDAHISLCQKLPLSGALIVSTPQEMALVDARRGADLFRAVGVPVLGFVQNMAFYQLPGGEKAYLFGQGGVARAAAEAGAELIGEVPLVQQVREASDAGTPLGGAAPGGGGRSLRRHSRAAGGEAGSGEMRGEGSED